MSTLKKKSSRQYNELSIHELLDEITINEEIWQCIVIMLVETDEYTQIDYVSMLNEICGKGYRKAVCAISRKKMLSAIHRSKQIENLDSG